MADEQPAKPPLVRRCSPCPKCGNRNFESYAFAMGEEEGPSGPRSFSSDLGRCTACRLPFRGTNGCWKRMTEEQFTAAVAAHNAHMVELRERLNRR